MDNKVYSLSLTHMLTVFLHAWNNIFLSVSHTHINLLPLTISLTEGVGLATPDNIKHVLRLHLTKTSDVEHRLWAQRGEKKCVVSFTDVLGRVSLIGYRERRRGGRFSTASVAGGIEPRPREKGS